MPNPIKKWERRLRRSRNRKGSYIIHQFEKKSIGKTQIFAFENPDFYVLAAKTSA
jgi:hypothetical protein